MEQGGDGRDPPGDPTHDHSDFHDKHLASLWMQGDTRAGNELVSKYIPSLRAYIYRHVGPTEAEDLAQAVWIKVHVALKARRYSPYPNARFSTWLWRIAANHLRDYWQSRHTDPLSSSVSIKSEHESEYSDELDSVDVIDNVSDPARDAAIRTDLAKYARKAGDLLLRQVDTPVKDLAKAYGTTPTGMGVRLYRERRKLKAFLSDDEQPDDDGGDDDGAA